MKNDLIKCIVFAVMIIFFVAAIIVQSSRKKISPLRSQELHNNVASDSKITTTTSGKSQPPNSDNLKPKNGFTADLATKKMTLGAIDIGNSLEAPARVIAIALAKVKLNENGIHIPENSVSSLMMRDGFLIVSFQNGKDSNALRMRGDLGSVIFDATGKIPIQVCGPGD